MSHSSLLFAVTSSRTGLLEMVPYHYWIVGLILLLVFSVLIFFIRCYKRCPSNRILVIYGSTSKKGQAAKCVAGGAHFVYPVIQDYAWLSLEPMQIEIPLRGALSYENIRVNVPSVFTVAIGTSEDLMLNAAMRLLGLTLIGIKKQAEDIIFGQLRQVIASMPIDDINRDREKFLVNIQQSLEPELRKIGLVLINVNITDITDESGYIEAIGQKAASEAIQKARGDVAENERMGAINVANAEREKSVRVAQANRDMNIGTREAERDQQIQIANLSKEQAIGEQSALFIQETEIKEAERDMRVKIANLSKEQAIGEQSARFIQESEIKEAEREMRVKIANANAKAIEGENQSKAVVAASNAELMIREAEAFKAGGTQRVIAEAAVKEAEHLAQAKAADAEAVRIEAQERAKLEAPAKAEKAKIIVEAEAEAERRKVEATGTAAEIYAKLEAQARGEYEILARKGDGLRRIIDACGSADAAFRLLMLEHFDNLIESSATAISNIKFDKIVVWDGNGKDGTTATSNWLSGMARTLPPILEVMKEVAGVDIMEALQRKETPPAALTNEGGESGESEEPTPQEEE